MTKKCIGCGSILQNINSNAIGYTMDINNELCERCFRLKNYGEYKNVPMNNKDYQKILDSIPNDSLVVYVVSLLNVNLEYINKFNNVLVVLTKRDLLPKSLKDNKLIKYIKNHTNSDIDIEVVSAIKNYNLDSLIDKLKKRGRGKEIYFVGMTNSGKSTLINALIKSYSDSEVEITTSLYPSTTLDKIEIDLGELRLVDTPGLLSEKSILSKLSLKDIKRITPKREIKPRSYQINKESSLLIDDIVRLEMNSKDNIVIYLANNLKILKLGKDNNILKESKKYEFNIKENSDLVIEDLCFIKLKRAGEITIYCPYDINIYIRDNLI